MKGFSQTKCLALSKRVFIRLRHSIIYCFARNFSYCSERTRWFIHTQLPRCHSSGMLVNSRRLLSPSFDTVYSKLLFTAGMTLVDSADSILMLYSYSGFPERTFIIFSPKPECKAPVTDLPPVGTDDPSAKDKEDDLEVNISGATPHEENKEHLDTLPSEDPNGELARNTRVKMNVMSGLSIILTLMSILVAFRLELPGSLSLFFPEL